MGEGRWQNLGAELKPTICGINVSANSIGGVRRPHYDDELHQDW
jgi:hypothetical protein